MLRKETEKLKIVSVFQLAIRNYCRTLFCPPCGESMPQAGKGAKADNTISKAPLRHSVPLPPQVGQKELITIANYLLPTVNLREVFL